LQLARCIWDESEQLDKGSDTMINNDTFSLATNEMSLAKLNGDEELAEAEILTSVDEFEEMSLSVQKKNKEQLAALKNKVMYSLDKRKLQEAQKLLGGMENIGELFSDPEILSKVKENTKTAMDLKFLSEAYSKMLDSQQKLMRLDSVDGQGNAAKISLAVQFEGASGNKVQTVIHAEG
jgi:hypothetical protein